MTTSDDGSPPGNAALGRVTASDGKDQADPALLWTLGGWALAVVLFAVQHLAPQVLQAGDRAATMAIADREGALMSFWSQGRDGPWPVAFLAFLAPILIPLTWRGFPDGLALKPPAWRAWAAGVATLLTALSVYMTAASDGRNGQYATADGVGWIRRGEVIRRHAWSEAVAVKAACAMVETRRRGHLPPKVLTPRFSYDISFPDDWSFSLSEASLDGDALDLVVRADAEIRKAGVPRETAINEECVVRKLPGRHRDADRLRAVLAP